MSQLLTITHQDILQEVKLSGKIHETIEAIINCKIINETATEIGIKVTSKELQKTALDCLIFN